MINSAVPNTIFEKAINRKEKLNIFQIKVINIMNFKKIVIINKGKFNFSY